METDTMLICLHPTLRHCASEIAILFDIMRAFVFSFLFTYHAHIKCFYYDGSNKILIFL